MNDDQKDTPSLGGNFETSPSVGCAYLALEECIDAVTKLVNDEIQLFIGSVQVRDSEAMRQQAERATMLTLLAAVYLPLQLVTGIFGMNIWEINAGAPKWWACLAALAVAGGLTSGLIAAYLMLKKRQE